MTSGRWRTTASSAASPGADVVHLDVDDLEGRPQESPSGVVVDDEQAHWRLP